jgi:molybdopterin synthase catalytic subunit
MWLAMSPNATGEPGARQPSDIHVYIGPEPVEPQRLQARAGCPEAGAVVQFCGTVRNHNKNARVMDLEYDAYVDMATEEIKKIIGEANKQWPLWTVNAVHRTGPLKVGDVAVCVTVGASHREEAFSACRYITDRLKAQAPIWKRETLESGAKRWLEEHRPEPRETGS